MTSSLLKQKAFTLVEIAIVLLIVSILLGFTVAMFSTQQEVKQYRTATHEMGKILDALVAFAQVNGRLPCPDVIAAPDGIEDYLAGVGTSDCSALSGFVPGKTLGLLGDYAVNKTFLDPWGQPYRYSVSTSETNGTAWDFTTTGEIQLIGTAALLPDLSICTTVVDPPPNPAVCANAATEIMANVPAVVISTGKSWQIDPDLGALTPLELENQDNDAVFIGRSSDTLNDGDDTHFDDIVLWLSPNLLYTKMIEAGQLP